MTDSAHLAGNGFFNRERRIDVGQTREDTEAHRTVCAQVATEPPPCQRTCKRSF